MSDPNAPQDPYTAGQQPEPPGGSTTPPEPSRPPMPPPPAAPSPYGSQPLAYGSQPPAPPPPPPPYGSQPAGYYGQSAYAYPKNSLGVWSLVLGIVSIFMCGFFAAIPAIIVGNRAKRAVAEGQANNGGMATAGVVIGWIVVGLSALAVVVVIIVVVTGNSSTFNTTNY